MNKSNIGWLFAVIALSILLIVSIVLGVNGYFFSMSFMSSKTDIALGETATIELAPEQTSVLSFTFDGSYLPKEKLPQRLQISAINSSVDLLIRVKAQIFGNGTDEKPEFITDEKFLFDGDYYYLQEPLGAGGKVMFCEYIQIPEDSRLSSKGKYIMTIVVESKENSLENQQKWGIVQQNG